MSLNWDATAVHDYKTLHTDEFELNKTAYLCFSLMGIGISTVKADNIGEIFIRLDMSNHYFGAPLNEPTEDGTYKPYFYTLDDIVRRIGYRSNVSDESRTAWVKRMFARRADDYQRKADRLIAQQTEAVGV
jgi:hypothetical protein